MNSRPGCLDVYTNLAFCCPLSMEMMLERVRAPEWKEACDMQGEEKRLEVWGRWYSICDGEGTVGVLLERLAGVSWILEAVWVLCEEETFLPVRIPVPTLEADLWTN